jgi:hypothetical protein
MRVSELQYLVYFCIIDYYILQMEKKVPSFEEIETNESTAAAPDRHFGNTLPLAWREDGEPKYVLGPHCTLKLTKM